MRKQLLLPILLAWSSYWLPAPEAAADVAEQEVLLETDFSEIGSWAEKLDVESGIGRSAHQRRPRTQFQLGYVCLEFYSEGNYEDVVLENGRKPTVPRTQQRLRSVCRANSADNRNGYYFLISGDGLVSIRRVERSLSLTHCGIDAAQCCAPGERANQLCHLRWGLSGTLCQ
ncbi:MAG: hypothetical protein R3D55_10220 [Chloroflexota bacterium]